MGKHSRLRKIKTVGEGSVFDKDKKLNVDVLKQRVPKKFTEMMELKVSVMPAESFSAML